MIKIVKREINNQDVNSVNARELWKFLESKRQFADWIKDRVEKYDFIENIDYIVVSQKNETQRKDGQSGIVVIKEYITTLDMAKELAMVENNDKGKEIRRYFIECEKELNQIKKDNSSLNLAKELKGYIEIANIFGIEGNQAILSANKTVKKLYNIDLLELTETKLIAPTKEILLTPTEVGKELSLSAVATNKLLEHLGYQIKTSNQWVLTNKGAIFAEVLDTNKKHSDGTPVKQIKWKDTILKELK